MIESKESYEELSLIVKDWLEKSKTAGHKLGELNSQNIRSFSKDEKSKFLGWGIREDRRKMVL